MSKVAHYLQEHLSGEVMTSADARRYFSTDASILTMAPSVVIYPRSENDVRKTARFTWQLAERGRVIPITARGAGTDLTGAALSKGIILAFPAHMHHITEYNSKSGTVIVEPGVNYGKLQQALYMQGRFLPPFPSSMEYSTLGGAVANNSSGEKSVKYGDTRNYTTGLRVVLANGELIETGRLSKRELNKKLGLATFEGEIYRALDALIEENRDLIKTNTKGITKDSSGYFLQDIKRRDGSFDLTPLIVGSQGTLGIVTEITLETVPHEVAKTLVVAHFDNLDNVQEAILKLRSFSEMPSAVEMVDKQLLEFVEKHNPNMLKDIANPPFASFVLLVEFDNPNERTRKKLAKKTQKMLEKLASDCKVTTDPSEQENLWKIRYATAALTSYSEGSIKALPLVEDGIVPPERLKEYLEGIYELFKRNQLESGTWGHVGDGQVHIQPLLDLGQVGDRQKVFRVMDEFYELVIGLGGSIAGEYAEGRLRAPYLKKHTQGELYDLFIKVKKIFDPHGTLNPGVKLGTSIDDIKVSLRDEYNLGDLYKYMPRS